MTHNTTVTPEVYEALQSRQRHIILKHDPLFMPEDTIMVSEPDSRDQLSFEIVSVEILHKRATLLSLYAPYGLELKVGSVNDIPDTVG